MNRLPSALSYLRPALRWLAGAAVVLAGAGGVLAPPVASAATAWQVTAGAQSEDQAIDVHGYLPNEITVDAGDSITWNFDPEGHTVTFLAPGQKPPPFQTAPVTANGASYDGTEYVNSGVETAADPPWTVVFATPGDYHFQCLIHLGQMSGTVHVQPAGTPYPSDQLAYDQQAQQEAADLLNRGRQLKADQQAAAASGPPNQVTIGGDFRTTNSGGATAVIIPRFLSQNLEVQVGDTVTWTATTHYAVHTVTFGPEPANAIRPSPNVTAGQAAWPTSPAGQTVNSGFLSLGAPPPPIAGTQFRVTFTQPGQYRYRCVLHDQLGMTGTIIVRPATGS